MLLIYCENITPRFKYISRYILEEICGFEIKITSDHSEYISFEGPSLNYSNRLFNKKEIQIAPASFLFENSLNPANPRIEKRDNEIDFYFPALHSELWVKDPVAASFFLLSRYEEYFPYSPGKYNSYEAHVSISFLHGILNKPLVNEWAEKLKRQLIEMFPSTPFCPQNFSAIVSIDIDQAFAFQNRGRLRNFLSFFRNIFFLNGKLLSAQIKTILFKGQDPYDTYTYLNQIQSESKLQFLYFVNLGDYSKFDKNLDTKNHSLKKLLAGIHSYAPVGIHPSFYSNDIPSKFDSEKKALEIMLGEPVTKSRQHYLKIMMPDTYHHLLNAGIEEDYSMGYSTRPGFRAGTCTPFYWFDLSKNEETKLKVYPVTFMEGTLGEDMKLTPTQGLKLMEDYIDLVKKYNGTLLCIWHNHSVNDWFFWKGWKKTFEQMIEKIKE
ncbi:MAG: polysaccharide deacetylase family protein [Bacteroidetes bacterium]|nr:polysaccharide deacetylase family protein [Bacteroidota bacterium]MBS1930116.1 polysaccharide deacetylase family protein [Bacteroidota bacterium]